MSRAWLRGTGTIVVLLIATSITSADVLDKEAEAEAGRVIWPLWTQCGEFHITKVVIPPGRRGSGAGGSFITQVKGAHLVAQGQPLTEADRLNALEWHGVVRFTALASRVHGPIRLSRGEREPPQWSQWREGAPSNYDRRLEKRQGKWQVFVAKNATTGTASDVAKETQPIACAELPR